MKRIWVIGWIGSGALLVLLLLQLVPYGRSHTNPPVTGTPAWDSPRTEALVRRACFDCHSNESRWPWYASVAPASWRVQKHVDEGRRELNFSTFDRPQKEASEAAEVVLEGEMPPWDYRLMHPEARLGAQDRRELAAGLRATLGGGTGHASGNAGSREHERSSRDSDRSQEAGENGDRD